MLKVLMNVAWLCGLVLLSAGSPLLAQSPALMERLPEDAFIAVAARPAAMMKQEELQLMPIEMVTAASLEALGLDVSQASDALVFVRADFGNTLRWGAMMTMEGSLDWESIDPPNMKRESDSGAGLWVLAGPQETVMTLVDDQTLLLGDRATVELMREKRAADTSLRRLLSAQPVEDSAIRVVMAYDMVRELVVAELKKAGPAPPPFGPVQGLASQIEFAELRIGIRQGDKARLTIGAVSEVAATRIEATLAGLLEILRGEFMKGAMEQPLDAQMPPAMQAAMGAYFERLSGEIVKRLTPQVEGQTVVVEMEAGVSAVGVGVALLLPAVQAAREAARRAQSSNNLKQIGLAAHMYHDDKQSFPPRYTYDAKKQDGLSWRVHLLPYLGEEELYKEFKLDEPWNSEHNAALIPRMPAVYANPNVPIEGQTTYMAVIHPDSILSDTKGNKIASITDGTSTTILVVEANAEAAVPWTAPGDLLLQDGQPFGGIGKLRPGVFLALFADGSVRAIAIELPLDQFRALVTKSGGEVTQVP